MDRSILDFAERLRTYAERRKHLASIVAELRSGGQFAQSSRPVTPFDALALSITGPPPHVAPQPMGQPSRRFMLRVAPTGRLHRATKRNYNYFDQLATALAATEDQERDRPVA
jgi:hypothetical protein